MNDSTYDSSLVYIKVENDILYVSTLTSTYELEGLNQDIINTYKDDYTESFIKHLKFKDNKVTDVYDIDEELFIGLKLSYSNKKKDLIEVRFKNDATGINEEVSEVYILLKKTKFN